MKHQQFITTMTIALVGCAWPAFAQTDRTEPDAKTSTTRASQDVCENHFLHRGSDLLGMDVRNAQDEDLGELNELVIQPEEGRIAYAVVSFGGVIGAGDKLFAFPWQLLQVVHRDGDDRHVILLSIDKERLKESPGFPKDNWPDINSPEWTKSIDEFYADELRGAAQPAEAGSRIEEAIDQGKRLRLLKLSDIDGCDVDTSDDEDAGRITNSGIDVAAGRVNFLVLSSGGFLGLGTDEFALPWDQCQFAFNDDNELSCKLKFTKSKFEGAPAFDGDNWNRMSDRAWVKEVYTYYGSQVYWPEASARAGTSGTK